MHAGALETLPAACPPARERRSSWGASIHWLFNRWHMQRVEAHPEGCLWRPMSDADSRALCERFTDEPHNAGQLPSFSQAEHPFEYSDFYWRLSCLLQEKKSSAPSTALVCGFIALARANTYKKVGRSGSTIYLLYRRDILILLRRQLINNLSVLVGQLLRFTLRKLAVVLGEGAILFHLLVGFNDVSTNVAHGNAAVLRETCLFSDPKWSDR